MLVYRLTFLLIIKIYTWNKWVGTTEVPISIELKLNLMVKNSSEWTGRDYSVKKVLYPLAQIQWIELYTCSEWLRRDYSVKKVSYTLYVQWLKFNIRVNNRLDFIPGVIGLEGTTLCRKSPTPMCSNSVRNTMGWTLYLEWVGWQVPLGVESLPLPCAQTQYQS